MYRFYTNLHLKHRQNPLSGSDALNDTAREIIYNITKTINDSFKCGKYFISETALSEFFPDLFNWIHFGRIRWNKVDSDIVRDFQPFRCMPAGTIADQENMIVWIML